MIPQKQQTQQNFAQQKQNNLIVFPGYGDSNPPSKKVVACNGTVDALSKEEIKVIKNYFLNQNKKHSLRNYAIFVLGCNSGLRTGDTVQLRIQDIMYKDFSFKEEVRLKEEKTGKYKTLWLRDCTKEAISMYLAAKIDIKYSDYLFTSQKGEYITRKSYSKLLKQVQYELQEVGLLSKSKNINTHSMRKSFGMDFYSKCIEHNKKQTSQENIISPIDQLSSIYNHSSTAVTRRYIGLTKQSHMDAYLGEDFKEGL